MIKSLSEKLVSTGGGGGGEGWLWGYNSNKSMQLLFPLLI